MKILFLSFYYTPDLCAGSFRAQSMVDALNEITNNEIEIDVLTTTPNRYSEFKIEAKRFEQIEKTQIHRIKISSHQSGMLDQAYAFVRYYKNVLRFVKNNEYDLVFATSSRLFTAFLGAMVSKRKRIPLFLDLRDILVDNMKCIMPWHKKVFLIPFLSLVERFTVKRAKSINLVSEGFKQYYLKLAPDKKYSFISNGIDTTFLTTNFEKTTLNNPQIITYAGNIGEGQGLDKIVPKLCKFLGDKYVLRIIGSGGKQKNLKDIIQSENITNIELLAPVDRAKLVEYYTDTDYLFLHLNNHKAFEKVLPSKLFEYGGIGKPIIAGVNGYAADFIKQNLKGALVFNACDIDDFKTKWNDFINIEIAEDREFKKEFARPRLMKKLAKLVLSTK